MAITPRNVASAAHLRTPITFNDLGQTVATTWQEVFAAADRIQAFFHEIQTRFVERDDLVRMLKYAMLLREHILIWGMPGTGKTAVADSVIQNIGGAIRWSSDLSKFTTETQVFGDFDIKKAQETGQLLHMTSLSLLEAHFANLGEFLDASAPLLRSLLRVLNERQFVRGPQHLIVPLMTGIANTNTDPREARQRTSDMAAVLDRFLFWYHVKYVEAPENRIRMAKMFMERRYDQPLPILTIEDIKLVSGVVLRTTLLTNSYILHAYEQVTREFGERRKLPVSDRRFNKGLQILDAAAILARRTEVDWEDLERLELVLCEDASEAVLFHEVLAGVVANWRGQQTTGISNAEVVAVDAFFLRLPKDPVESMSDAELLSAKRLLHALKQEVEGFHVSNAAASSRRSELLGKIQELSTVVQHRIDNA